MFNFNIGDFPQKIKQDVAYILYYTFNSYIPFLFLIIIGMNTGQIPKSSDYIVFGTALLYSFTSGFIVWLILPSPEKKSIKRRHFAIGLIHVLSENKSISFNDLTNKYSYCVFGSKSIAFRYREYAKSLIILINLGIIELVNGKDFLVCGNEFDFDLFEKNLGKMIFRLKSKNIDLDALVKRVENYLF